ncbi:MAG: ATP-binding cassette domain-containing protein [Halanaerobiales bacterium]
MADKFSPVIEVRNLTKKYRNIYAVNNISFSVSRGEVFGFLGPNGAGKTTTINMLLGLLQPDNGYCSLFQRNTREIDDFIYQKLGVVFEEKNLYQRLTGYQNLSFFAQMYQVRTERIKKLLKRFGLEDAAQRQVKTYSKGMRQRLLICRALLSDPELLILDEPTGGLDPVSLRIIHNSILELKKEKKTVLLSTHYMEEAEKLCDRMAFINNGKLIAVSTPDQLKQEFGEKVLELKTNCLKGDRQIESLSLLLDEKDGIVFNNDYTSVLLSLEYSDTGKKMDKVKEITDIISIHSREASLHDVFISLTAGKNPGRNC